MHSQSKSRIEGCHQLNLLSILYIISQSFDTHSCCDHTLEPNKRFLGTVADEFWIGPAQRSAPWVASQDFMSDVEATDWVVGCQVSVKTQNEAIRGEVFAFDKPSDTVLIRQQGSTPFHNNLRLLKTKYIKVNFLVSCVWHAQRPILPPVDLYTCVNVTHEPLAVSSHMSRCRIASASWR